MTSSPNVKFYRLLFLICCIATVTIAILYSPWTTFKHLDHLQRRYRPATNSNTTPSPTRNIIRWTTSVQRLTLEQQCIKEVLQRLGLPVRLKRLLLSHSLHQVLKLAELSETCRNFLTPKPVSKKREKELACFLPKPWFDHFLPYGKERIQSAVLLIANAYRKANIPIYLDSGTALGSWRMHGRIPYNPDINFMVERNYRDKSRAVCQELMGTHPHLFNHYLNGHNVFRMDVRLRNSTDLFKISIFHYVLDLQEGTMVSALGGKVKIDKLTPFVMRPFEGLLLPTWRNLTNYFEQLYGKNAIETCKPSSWISQHYNISCVAGTVKCKELNYFFNFVHRWKQRNGHLIEVLFNRTHVLSVFHAFAGE